MCAVNFAFSARRSQKLDTSASDAASSDQSQRVAPSPVSAPAVSTKLSSGNNAQPEFSREFCCYPALVAQGIERRTPKPGEA